MIALALTQEDKESEQDSYDDDSDGARRPARGGGRGSGRGRGRGGSRGNASRRGRKAQAGASSKSSVQVDAPIAGPREAEALRKAASAAAMRGEEPAFPSFVPTCASLQQSIDHSPSLAETSPPPLRLRVSEKTSADHARMQTICAYNSISYGAADHPAVGTSHKHATAHFCHAGGSVWDVGWLPGPPGSSEPQHFAVATYVDGARHTLASGPNVIQLWQLGAGGGDPAAHRASTEAPETCTTSGAVLWLKIMHGGAGVLALSWCPRGNHLPQPSQQVTRGSQSASLASPAQPSTPSTSADLDRLGLLAAACADGRVRIFAIPTRGSLRAAVSASLPMMDDGSDRSACVPRLWLPPVLQLEPTSDVLTLSLSWCATSTQYLAAGLNDGTCKVWNLSEACKSGGAPNDAAPGAGEGAMAGAEGAATTEDDDGGGVASGGEESLCLGRPDTTLFVPHCVFGLPSGGSAGSISLAYARSFTGQVVSTGHAGPVRSVRWSNPPDELLGSVGHDGVLCVWDHTRRYPLLQVHEVSPYSWALDLVWSQVSSAIIVSVDEPSLRIAPLDDSVKVSSTRLSLSDDKSNAAVWALGASAFGDKLACATSAGRLELLRCAHPDRKNAKRVSDVYGCVQLGACPSAPSSESTDANVDADAGVLSSAVVVAEGPVISVALGEAAHAPPASPGGAPLPPAEVALRNVHWNPNVGHEKWLACGSTSGLVLLLSVP